MSRTGKTLVCSEKAGINPESTPFHPPERMMKNIFRYPLIPVALAAMLICGAPPAWAFRQSASQKSDAVRFKTKPEAAPVETLYLPSAQRQRAAAASASMPFTQARYRQDSSIPRTLMNGVKTYPGAPAAAAQRFLEENRNYLGLDPSQLKLEKSIESLGITHLLYRQYYNGLPVENASVKVHMDKQGKVAYYSSTHLAATSLDTNPSLARGSAASRVSADGAAPSSTGELVVFRSPSDGKASLAWKIRAADKSNDEPWIYYVDAKTGALLFRESLRRYAVSGTVQGHVYTDYPRATDFSDCSTVTIRNQYVWLQGASTRTVTDSSGNFSFGLNGKVFASLKGPYITIANNMGRNAHYDNGSGTWGICALSPSNPAITNYTGGTQTQPTIYTTTVSVVSPGTYFAKVEPSLATNFNLGSGDSDDALLFLDPSSGYSMASYYGQRVNAFKGPQLETPSFVLQLESHGGSGNSGFTVASAQCLTLQNPAINASADGSFTWTSSQITPWSTSYGVTRNMAEVNAFHHLNELHDYMNNGVNSAGLINIDTPVTILVEASPEPDNMPEGYANGYYAVTTRMLVLGNGYYDATLNRFRSMGLDSPTLRHEYVHVIQDRIFTAPYFAEAGAIQEAMSDYFSLSSMHKSAPNPNQDPMGSVIGAFAFPFDTRTLDSDCNNPSGSCSRYSADNWTSEVHWDSIPLSQSLWELRHSSYSTTWLGLRAEGPRSDAFVFQSLFFLPETFFEFRDAMQMVCDRLEGTAACSTNYLPKMQTAFTNHTITAPPAGTDSYEPNNGMTTAANISTSPFAATINPEYDLDYYSLSAPTGTVSVTISFPPSELHARTYHAYMITIKDPFDRLLSENIPPLDPDSQTISGYCPSSGECFTRQSSMTVTQTLPHSGRYSILVSAGIMEGNGYIGGNGPDISTAPYTLTLDYDPAGAIDANVANATFDNDVFTFSAPYDTYDYLAAPSWISTMTARVENYERAELRDVNRIFLPEMTTEAGGRLETVSVSTTAVSGRITGQIRLKSGFAARYPSVGTVLLEIFGRTRKDKVVSLGVSTPMQIAGNTNSVQVWNNIFTPNTSGTCSQFGSDCLTVSYSVLSAGTISVKIYSRDGTLINTLSNSAVAAGKGNFYWNGSNSSGNTVASGLYIVKITGPGIDTTKKVVVVK